MGDEDDLLEKKVQQLEMELHVKDLSLKNLRETITNLIHERDRVQGELSKAKEENCDLVARVLELEGLLNALKREKEETGLPHERVSNDAQREELAKQSTHPSIAPQAPSQRQQPVATVAACSPTAQETTSMEQVVLGRSGFSVNKALHNPCHMDIVRAQRDKASDFCSLKSKLSGDRTIPNSLLSETQERFNPHSLSYDTRGPESAYYINAHGSRDSELTKSPVVNKKQRPNPPTKARHPWNRYQLLKSVSIRRGAYKGATGIVRELRGPTATVELHSNGRIVYIPCKELKVVGGADGRTGDVTTYSRTPGYSGPSSSSRATPMHRMGDGGRTPIHGAQKILSGGNSALSSGRTNVTPRMPSSKRRKRGHNGTEYQTAGIEVMIKETHPDLELRRQTGVIWKVIEDICAVFLVEEERMVYVESDQLVPGSPSD